MLVNKELNMAQPSGKILEDFLSHLSTSHKNISPLKNDIMHYTQ